MCCPSYVLCVFIMRQVKWCKFNGFNPVPSSSKIFNGFKMKEAEDAEDGETWRIDLKRDVSNDKLAIKCKRSNTDHIDGLQDGDDESSEEESGAIDLKRGAVIDKLPIKRKRLNADHVDCSGVTKLAREINSNDGDLALSKSKANVDVFTGSDHVPSAIVSDSKKKYPQRKCIVCRRYGTRRDTRYCCKDCIGFPALCKSPCFMTYHTIHNI